MDLKTRLAENIYQTIKTEKLNTNEIVKLLRQVELEVLEKQISETHNPGERYVLHKNGYIQKFSKQKMKKLVKVLKVGSQTKLWRLQKNDLFKSRSIYSKRKCDKSCK